ncbi:MAG: RidA family protein [Candidatus Rokubacteria bacterium]|nr:RidA family protein [Candidatus Rokubacteria bacterium]
MARRVLTPTGEGKPLGMYSAGFEVDAGRLVFVAGKVAVDADGQLVGAGDIAAQAAQVYRNLEAVLREAGCTFRDVVKLSTFLTRPENIPRLAEWRKQEYPRLFPDGIYPPNTGVVVQALGRPEWLLEVEAIAVKPAGSTATRPVRRPTARVAKGTARRAGRRR